MIHHAQRLLVRRGLAAPPAHYRRQPQRLAQQQFVTQCHVQLHQEHGGAGVELLESDSDGPEESIRCLVEGDGVIADIHVAVGIDVLGTNDEVRVLDGSGGKGN